MEVLFLLPAFVIAVLLYEAGWSHTEIMLLWNGLVFGFFWLIDRFDRRTEQKPVRKTASFVCAGLAFLSGAGIVLLFAFCTDLQSACVLSLLLPLTIGSLWFLTLMFREEL